MQNAAAFKLNNKVLYDRIEAIKKSPPPEILAYLAAHPEYKAVNCAMLADYIGISERTLTNLKLGKLTDSNCSTIWLICTALDIDLRDFYGVTWQSDCDPTTCSSHTQARLVKEQSEELGAAKAKAEAYAQLVAVKDASIAKFWTAVCALVVCCALSLFSVLVLIIR